LRDAPPRAATWCWQEGRWQLLAARAAQYRAAAQVAPGAPETRMLVERRGAGGRNRQPELALEG
jgi:hypothetical protein